MDRVLAVLQLRVHELSELYQTLSHVLRCLLLALSSPENRFSRTNRIQQSLTFTLLPLL